jgi:Dolichyl-phosphate-mannose-protein mannosyltransferase
MPFVALTCGVVVCVILSFTMTTGYDSHTKLRHLLLQLFLVLPGAVWVLRQRAEAPGDSRRLPVLPFFLLFTIAVVPLSWYVRDGIYNGDESAYLFNAKLFASLHAYSQAPPDSVRQDFSFEHHVIYQGRWFGKYPPGWPAILGGLSKLLPLWSITPALGLLLLWLIYAISIRLYDKKTASLAVALMACSPYFLLMCIGYMSHVACAVLLALATLALVTGFETGKVAHFALMFAALSLAFLIRPFSAVCVGVPLAGSVIWNLKDDWRRLLKIAAAGTMFVASACFTLLYDNKVLTGKYWLSPYALYLKSDTVRELHPTAMNVIRYAITIAPVSLGRLALYTFPFILLLSIYAVIHERSRRSLLLLCIALSLIVGYTLTIPLPSDSFIGERYYFDVYFAIGILSAAGWEKLRRNWEPSATAVRALVLALGCLSLYYYVYAAHAAIRFHRAYYSVYRAAQKTTQGRVLVFMAPSKYFDPHNYNPNPGDWESARVLFVVDPGQEGRTLAASILKRPLWLVMSYDPNAECAVIKESAQQ